MIKAKPQNTFHHLNNLKEAHLSLDLVDLAEGSLLGVAVLGGVELRLQLVDLRERTVRARAAGGGSFGGLTRVWRGIRVNDAAMRWRTRGHLGVGLGDLVGDLLLVRGLAVELLLRALLFILGLLKLVLDRLHLLSLCVRLLLLLLVLLLRLLLLLVLLLLLLLLLLLGLGLLLLLLLLGLLLLLLGLFLGLLSLLLGRSRRSLPHKILSASRP